MSAIRLRGATSGTTDVVAAAIAGDGVLSLPTGTGTLATQAFVDAAVAAGGKVLQVVRNTDSTDRSTTSTSFVDVTGMTVSITPTVSTSNILLIFNYRLSSVSSGAAAQMQITDSANVAISGAELNQLGPSANLSQITTIGWVASGSTSVRTYKLRFKNFTAGTVLIQNSQNSGQMFAIEVAA